MTLPRLPWHNGLMLLLALSSAVELPAQVTTINVNSNVIQSPVKRFGINLGTPNFYDSGQMTKNLVFTTNPSFEGEIYQSTVECGQATATSCTDANFYSGWPGGFWNYATYTIISGSAAGRTGTVCGFTPSLPNTYPNGGTFTFCDSGTAPSPYDYMIVKIKLPADVGWPLGGDWLTTVGNGTFTAETNDLPPGTLGKQSGLLTAPTGGDSISVNMFFDSTTTKSFVQLNGQYQLTFKAKGISGNQNVGVSLTRGTTTFISQTMPLTNGWATYTMSFNGSETGSALGRVELSFTAAGPDTIELDDVSLIKLGTDPTNTTIFRDEVIQALQNAKPGVLRYWVDQLGESLDNMLTAPTGRQRSGYTPYAGFDGTNITLVNGIPTIGTFQTQSVKVGLTDFLQLAQKVGADPWIVVPSTFSTTEAYELMDYLAGASTTEYGAIRAASGQTAPWTSVFNVIHLEFGNEEWNGGTFKGGAIETGAAYGQAASSIFAIIKNHPSYVHSSFDLIVNGQSANPGGNQIIQQNTTNNDSFSIAPYMMYNVNNWTSYDKLFGTTFAEAEAFVTANSSSEGVTGGYITEEQNPATGPGKPIVTSEMNLSPTGAPPSGGDGPLTQAALNGFASSVGGGVAVLDSMLQQLRAGVLTQNLFALPGWDVATQTNTNAFLWGAVVDMGVTNLKRPQYLALQLANEAIGSNTQMLQTTQTGTNPTDNQYNYGLNSVTLPTLHFIQSFAFGGSGTNSVVVFNVSPDYSEPINFAGSNAPTGTVNIQQLWSTNPTDNNETSSVVVPTSNTVANFNPSTNISLPPYSMTVFTWGNLSQQTQTITFGSIGTQTVGTPLMLTATASSGLSVAYSSSTTSVCTVSGSIATFLSGGTCTIVASQAGNSSYSAATPVTQSFSVTSPSQTQSITFASIATQTVGTPLTLMATASSGLPVSYSTSTGTICTLSGSTVSFLTNGTCSITASQAGNSTYSAATPVTQSFSVVLKPQTITFGTIPTQVVGTPLALTATATSGLAVSYASNTGTVCTVTGSTATFLMNGTCSITASQAGSSTYAAAAPVTQSFSVGGTTPQTISFGTIAAQTVGTPLTLGATATSSLTVSYTSTTGSVCSVSGNVATFLTGGTCSITATQPGNATYAAATPVTQSFSVVATQTITFGTIASQTAGTTLMLSASASSGLAVSYASSTTGICTVSSNIATFVAGGTCTITASQAGNSSYAAATPVSQSFTVLKTQTITFGSISSQTVGTPLTLMATATSGLAVSYASTTAAVCTVSNSSVTFIAGGTCSITASQAGNSSYAAATPVSQSFAVTGPQTITFGSIATQTVGTPLTLTATASSSLPVSYSSSTTAAVCTVSGSTATFLTAGTCTITASQAGNSTFAAATPVSQSFMVLNSQTIIFGAIASQVVGTPLTLTATASSGLAVSYASSTTPVCTVANSVVTFLAGGTCSITASQAGNSTYAAAAPVTQTFNVLGPQTITFGTIATQAVGTPLTLTATASSGLPVTYSSSTTPVCTVSGSVATFVTGGTCTIKASQAGNGTFAAATPVSQSFTVLAAQTITFGTIANQSVGVPLTLTATSTSGLAVSYASSTTSICTVSGSTATFLASGTCTITASQAGNTTYAAATPVTQSFTVGTPNAPQVGYVAYWGINNNGLTVSWSTDVPANTQLAYGTTKALGSLSPLQTTLAASHGVVLTTLNPGTTYYFVAQSTGANGVTGYSSVYSFMTTGTAPANPPPVISGTGAASITDTSAIINWTTDEPSSSQVNYGATTAYGQMSTLDTTLVTSHSVTLTGLTPGTTYNFDVVSTNATNQSSTSGNSTFATTGTVPAPMISNVATSGLTSSAATVTWTTDQATSSLVNYGTSTSYGLSSSSATLVTSHSITLTGLTPGTAYDFDVVSANASNVMSMSTNATFTTPTASGPAPSVGYVAFWGVNNNGVTISWSTDVPATTQLSYGTSMTVGTLTPLQTTLAASHGVVLTTLNPGTTYYFVAQSTGANGVTGYSTVYNFTTTGTAPTNPPPVISNVAAGSITGTTAIISWTTDQASSSLVNYGATSSYGLASSPNSNLVTTHSVYLTGLAPGTTYNFDVVSANAAGISATSGNATFTTTGTSPAPVISNVISSGATSSSVTIMWNTDQAATSLVNYGTTMSYGLSSSSPTLTTSHSVTLTGLTPGTTYDFDVASANAANASSMSANFTFATTTASGTAPNVGYVAFYGVTNTSVVISWSTDVPANTQVNYGTTMSMGTQSPLQTALTVSHGVTLNGLTPGTTYYFEAESTGSNSVTGYSTQYSFTTTGSNLTISNVTVSPGSSNAATISWTTSAPANSYVQYGPSAGNYNRYSNETGLITNPQCTLGYVPSGVIHYQLVSTDAYGNQVVSPDATFTEP